MPSSPATISWGRSKTCNCWVRDKEKLLTTMPVAVAKVLVSVSVPQTLFPHAGATRANDSRTAALQGRSPELREPQPLKMGICLFSEGGGVSGSKRSLCKHSWKDSGNEGRPASSEDAQICKDH